MTLQLYISGSMTLPDDNQWQYRFYVESETSNRLYIISQNIKHRHWGCSCPGWKRYRKCKHLQALGLPGNEQPFEVNLIKT
ncbi:hypothetical protein [Paraflavitalea pollutisoli]|uniref:hypothetical protein n=1 Tax=Paraflavitalea pollutisoli TaxID=3034143 RepID=UPI0023EC4145|nr:hypothetical protein [Paraflavitalea sp. H1-2-19X]